MSRPPAIVFETLHATTVALPVRPGRLPRALMILGPSGSGKSALALRMIAAGARLVSDDRTRLSLRGGRLIATPLPAIRGLIEARGLGVLRTPTLAEAEVVAALDLALIETERMPEHRWRSFLGRQVPLLRLADAPHFPAALMLYLAQGSDPAGGDRGGKGS